MKDRQRELIEHHATYTFAEDIPIIERIQPGLSSDDYKPGPLMNDEEHTDLSEHGVAVIHKLWRDEMEFRDSP